MTAAAPSLPTPLPRDNKDAKPGPTQWFTTNRGDGSFDYDCDATQERDDEIPPGGACQYCEFSHTKYPDSQCNRTHARFGCDCTAMGCVPGWQSGLSAEVCLRRNDDPRHLQAEPRNRADGAVDLGHDLHEGGDGAPVHRHPTLPLTPPPSHTPE